MQETLKYIKVLNWGYGGFCSSFENIAPLSLSQDFDSSLEQIEKRLAVVDGLNYKALYVEATSANGKANLEKYRSVEDSIEYSLHFVRDRKALLEKHIPTMYDGFKRIADQYKADGIWTWEQYQECRGALNELRRGFEVRLKEFCGAYDYKLGDDPNSPEPQQIPAELDTQEAKVYLDKAIELGLMDSNYKWLKGLQMLACFAVEMSKRLKLGKGERISWKPFETLFSVNSGKLRLNYNDIQKTGQQPKESYLIDRVFE
jgi:hypothetical protein